MSNAATEILSKTAIPLKFQDHKLIPESVPNNIKPSNQILQGRLCDMANNIKEWSNVIINSAKQNKNWMPVNTTADLLKSRLEDLLKEMDEYHKSLDVKPPSVDEVISEKEKVASIKSKPPANVQIPQEHLPFLDSNFASAVAYQQYYPYFYQPQLQQQSQSVPYSQRPLYSQPPMLQQSSSDLSNLSPLQMQQLYSQQQFQMQQNPMFMMPPYSSEQPLQQQYLVPISSFPSQIHSPISPEEKSQERSGDTDFTKLLFEDMENQN
eukprot:NODE_4_length_55019_cov_0.425091.p23 type:complete len:266 gc:universal NODE_4_length_55019_cov_0.425091:42330-43127(+)